MQTDFFGECVKLHLRRLASLLATSMAFALSLTCPVQAQDAEWEKLQREIGEFHSQGNYGQAVIVARQALSVAEKTFGPDSSNVALNLNALASLYHTQGQNAQAEPLLNRALVIYEKALGPDHPTVVKNLNNLAAVYSAQGKYAQAESMEMRVLAISERTLGPDHPDVATSLNNLAVLYDTQGQYARAEPLYKRSLTIREKTLGADHTDVAASLNNLAELHHSKGQFAQAEPLFKRSLAIWEKVLGPDHPNVGTSLHNLAALYRDEGEYAQAEPLSKRALAIQEKALGLTHPDVATSLNGLAELYSIQGQYAQAEPLYKRALVIRENAFGPDHPNVANSLNHLASLYRDQGQFSQVEQFTKRAVRIQEKTLGPDHPDVASTLINLGLCYNDQGRYTEAEALLKRSLAIREKILGTDHPDVGVSLDILAGLYFSQGQFAKSEPLSKRALAIVAKSAGPNHPDMATSLNNLVWMYDTQGLYPGALRLARRASSIYRQRIVTGGTSDATIWNASRNRSGFLKHLSLLSRNPDKEPADKITDEAFQIVQLEQASGTASAIAKMASRFSTGDDALASLIKRKQDASEQRSRSETLLVSAASKPPQQRNAENEQRVRDNITSAEKEIESIDVELMRRFPEYQELTRPEPATVSQVQALLKPGEAMLVYALDSPSFIWVVKPDGAIFQTLQVDAKDIAKKVATIHAEMEFDNNDRAKRVSVGVLHALYQTIFAPALPHLAGVKHVMVVPSGPLQSLPFSMLVASPPPEIKSDADYRRVDWLAKRYAFSVLPSVSSIQAFRQFTKLSTAQEPFAGFGDPLIGGASGTTRGQRAKMDVAAVFRNSLVNANARPSTRAAEIADVEAIRNAPRLPETADELRAMAKALKSDHHSLWLREKATETKIKQLDLSKYRTLAFATHGLMAGEIKGIGEAGLILTPPREGSIEDDGYLSASEIAKLKLNADLVILSACNTAAADGTPGAEGLSGLAKAFFYAGARSLLVSHWPVASEATVPLTTGMLKEYEANPAQGKAEAHRKAMLALIDTPDHPGYAHPLFWAPFVVVGEGGAGKRIEADKNK